MRIVTLIVIVLVALLSPPASAQIRSPQRPVTPPFSKLFRAPSSPSPKPSAPSMPFTLKSPPSPFSQRQAATVVCGMTIVPVDGSLDPKIEHPVPANGVKFTLKTVKPPACAP